MRKTSRSTTTWWTASRWTSSTRWTSSRWTSCSSRGTSFARITKSREQQHFSRTCSSSHNRCTVSQAGVQRGALVGHRQRPVWVWEVVEECSTYWNGQPFKNKKSAIILHSVKRECCKKGWPVTASPIVPRPVSVTVGSFPTKGSTCIYFSWPSWSNANDKPTSSWTNCQPAQRMFGFGASASCSAGWSGIWEGGSDQFFEIRTTSCCTLLETMTRLPL